MYARIENDQIAEYPLDEWQVKERFPNLSFPADFANNLPSGYVRVLPSSSPSETEITVVTESTPVMQDGDWVQAWTVSDRFTAEEMAQREADKVKALWQGVRKQRNDLLSGSDWIVFRHRDEKELGLPTTISDGAYLVWMQWRQQLRDITKTASDPRDIEFPAAPDQLSVVEM